MICLRKCRYALIKSSYKNILRESKYLIVTNNVQWLRKEMWSNYQDRLGLEGEYSNPEPGVLIRWVQKKDGNIEYTYDIVDLESYSMNGADSIEVAVFEKDVDDIRRGYHV